MFQPQQSQSSHRKTHIMAPTVASQNEAQAKEKLSGYVYEYLVHVGAPKAAEVFKSELLSQQNLSQIAPGDPPGFLHNWWCVFWDLYSAAPERKNKYDPSQEAKAFHEYGFIPPSTFVPGSLMNGVHPVSQFGNGAPGLGPMGIQSNADGIVPNYFAGRGGNQPVPSAVPSNQASPIAGGPRYMGSHPGAGPRSGAPTPSNVINNAGGSVSTNFPSGTSAAHMFANDQQMRNMVAAQRMNSNSVRMPNFPQQMRHIRPGCPSGFPSASGQFLDSPSGTPPFSQNLGMLPNGMCSAASLLSSPGGQTSGVNGIPGSVGAPPSNIDPSSHDPRFMMMAGGSAQFSLNHHDGAGTPTSCAGSGVSTSVPSGFNGMQLNSVVAGANAPDGTNPSVSGIGGQFQSLLNGGGDVSGIDMKQSPISHMNGSTPGGGHTNPGSIQQQQQQGGGPASVHGCHGDPGSVHSQPGGLAPGSVLGVAGPNSQQATQPHQTPTSDSSQSAAMDFQPSVPTSNSGGGDDEMEISKIKASLIEGFGPGSGSFGSV